jgi:hypothetical protein
MNWWLLKDRSDPGNMIEWLEQELLALEKDNATAIVIGHIPPV